MTRAIRYHALAIGLCLASAGLTAEVPPIARAAQGDEATAVEEPTFAADIAPLVFQRCAPCHHDGGSGPFPLISYRDVKKRARQIAIVATTRFMPPWKPTPGYGSFNDVRRLSDEEIARIVAWADAGAPLGDPAELPPTPEFDGAWLLGQPDVVLEMTEPYRLQAEGLDVYRTFVIPSGFTEERYLRAFDFQPDNPRVVHHIITLLDPTAAARAADEADPDVGYEGMVAEGELFGHEIHGWAQGATARFLPEGSAWVVPRGTHFVLDTHFQTTGRREDVKVAIGLYFTDERPAKPMTNVSISGPSINIPPGVSDYVIRQSFRLPTAVDVVSVQPHGHYVGTDFTVTAELPDGGIVKLIRIDDWDFNWQDSYRFVEPVPLPAGALIRMHYVFDNSAANDRNPFVPPRRILSGPRSTDEMALLWLQVAVDEDDLPTLKRAVQAHHDRNQKTCEMYIALYDGIVYGFDANKDGMLDPEEDAAATAYMNALVENEAHSIAFDADNDGALSDEEVDTIRRVIRYWNGEPMPETE